MTKFDQDLTQALSILEEGTMGDCQTKVKNWLNDPVIAPEDKQEIIDLVMQKDVPQLRDRFYKDLEFGTGGIRGVMGAGTNRLNRYVVRRAVQGFANYILKVVPEQKSKGIAIAYDCRQNSSFFSKEVAGVLCANGIKVFLYPDISTTPALSYAIRKLGCLGGICITASHNPPEYNGMKIYWDDGAQVVSPQDKGILAEVMSIASFSDISFLPFEQIQNHPLLSFIGQEVLDQYYDEIKKLSLVPSATRLLSIVYTPLHGTGTKFVLQALGNAGYENVFVVPEQAEPDGRFPTLKKPNPEEPEALSMALHYGTERKADVIFATDPDSDRLAMAVRHPEMAHGAMKHQSHGDFVLFNGNQLGALLIDFILNQKSINGSLKKEHKIIKTIVTSDLHESICQKYHVQVFSTLTGFKWIAGLIRQWEQQHLDHEYLFGTEESFGFMPANNVRDKDAVSTICLAAEMLSCLKDQGKTACDHLFDIFQQHGAWQEDLMSIELYGEAGLQRINHIMSVLRQQAQEKLRFFKIVEIRDFKTEQTCQKFHVPQSDVLAFVLEDGSKISIRPSGTEPKLKIYLSVCTKGSIKTNDLYEKSIEKIQAIRQNLQDALLSL